MIPIVLSLVVLAAHFLRGGNLVVVLAILLVIPLLGVRRRWAARTIQVVLILGAVEWLRTLLMLAMSRMREGEPAVRMVIILGAVAVVTGLCALVFQTEAMRSRYRFATDPDE
jgi:hypothetical protein